MTRIQRWMDELESFLTPLAQLYRFKLVLSSETRSYKALLWIWVSAVLPCPESESSAGDGVAVSGLNRSEPAHTQIAIICQAEEKIRVWGCVFEDSFSQMSEIWETSPTQSTPNNAYQISGQTEFKPLKSKNALQSLPGKAATTGSDMLGKLNMIISHCYKKNDIISTWHFSLILVLDVYWSSVLPSWYFWHRILLHLFLFSSY